MKTSEVCPFFDLWAITWGEVAQTRLAKPVGQELRANPRNSGAPRHRAPSGLVAAGRIGPLLALRVLAQGPKTCVGV